jgi:ubiquitin-protein ligase
MSVAVKRLQKEYLKILKEPIPNINVSPDEENILTWYFIIYKLDNPYKNGEYIGVINFTNEYPFKPPTFKFITPNGRFEVDKTICTTFSHYHPEEWSSLWDISGMLLGLVSFMYEESEKSIGSIKLSEKERKKIANNSRKFNLNEKKIIKLFPNLY